MSIGMCIYYCIYSAIVMNDKMKSKSVGKKIFYLLLCISSISMMSIYSRNKRKYRQKRQYIIYMN